MRITVWVLGDQLLLPHPAVERALAETRDVGILLIENWQRAQRLNYHKQKIALIFSAMRHYADELRGAGFQVDYAKADNLRGALVDHAQRFKPDRVLTMAASEYRGRRFQHEQLSAVFSCDVEVVPNTQFLVGRYDPFPNPNKRVVLETFYRAMRRHFGVLMNGDQPVGGAWNFDSANRKPLPKSGVRLPQTPHYEPDAITMDVIAEIERRGIGWGSAARFGWATRRTDAESALETFLRERLPLFGDYEDAMTVHSRTLYHSTLSPYLNLGLLDPLELARAAEAVYFRGDAPINAVEGFIRQIIGWREYMAWHYWRSMPGLAGANAWNAARPVPAALWDGQTDMNCLRHVIEGVLDTGYAHHIERLMVLSNYMMLCGVRPDAATEWFSAAHVDAYDWVMQTNVVGMGLNADGGMIATKPYIASANYINRMSDYCGGCRFDPKARTGPNACPFNTLYWNFLIEHEARLRANPRFGPVVLGLKRLDAEERAAIRDQAQRYLDELDSSCLIS